MINKNLIVYLLILIFGLAAPFVFPAFKVQLSILCVLIILAITWNIQGGEMGYNSFGNILFYGLGMYLCASVQVGMFFPLAEWTESGGEKTFVHTPAQFFQGFGVGLAVAAIVPTIVAGFIGYSIFGLIGQLSKNDVLVEIPNYMYLFMFVFIGGQIGNFLNIKIFSPRILTLITAFLVIFVAIRMGFKLGGIF